jgi:hypothetical protein
MRTNQNLFKTLLMAVIILSWAACNNQSESEEKTEPGKTETHDKHANDGHHESTNENKLQLNNGKKWPADFETTKGVAELTRKVVDFKEHFPEPAVDDYRTLAKSLKMTLNEIFDKCSMTGPAHDELHKFLVPVIEYVKTLNGDDPAGSTEAFGNLEKQLTLFGEYFE